MNAHLFDARICATSPHSPAGANVEAGFDDATFYISADVIPGDDVAVTGPECPERSVLLCVSTWLR